VEEEKRRKNGTPPASSSIRFGPYELDLRSAELRKSNLRIRLQEQPFLILVALLERPGEVVLREEIRNRLWPDNTVVEFDHGINAAVKRLRDALCESVEKPRYIETLPRKGYRFIGKVEVDSSEQAKPPVEQEDGAAPVDAERTLNPASSLYVETHHRRGRGRHWNWALPGAAIILMLAAGLLY
jgi:DNA-binding winged helix-turn-helix (wHTH) protein